MTTAKPAVTGTEKFMWVALACLLAWIWAPNFLGPEVTFTATASQVFLTLMLLGCGLMLLSGRQISTQTAELAEANRREREAFEAEYPPLE